MLDFLLLLEILLCCAAVYGLILLIKYIKGRIGIYVTYGSTDILSELGDLRKEKSNGTTGYEVKISPWYGIVKYYSRFLNLSGPG